MEKRRVLIADGDENMRTLIGLALETEDFELLYAPDGEQALALALLEKPHLIVLEMSLAHLAGGEVCRLLRGNPTTAGVKVIFLTTRTESNYRKLASQVAADAYITKPFSPLALLSRVRALLGDGHAHSQEHAG